MTSWNDAHPFAPEVKPEVSEENVTADWPNERTSFKLGRD